MRLVGIFSRHETALGKEIEILSQVANLMSDQLRILTMQEYAGEMSQKVNLPLVQPSFQHNYC